MYRKSEARITDRPDMTAAVYGGRKVKKSNKTESSISVQTKSSHFYPNGANRVSLRYRK